MGCYVITAGFGPHSELNFCKEFDTVVNYERFLSDIQNQDLTITNDNAKKAMLYLYIYMVVKSPKSHLVKDLFDDALFSIGEADKRDSVSNMALMINENIAGDLIEW